jgi:hypothetical protein
MKPNLIETLTAVNRLATSEEIRAAISPLPGRPEEYATDTVFEIAADLGGYVRIPVVEFETFRLINELIEDQDAWAN